VRWIRPSAHKAEGHANEAYECGVTLVRDTCSFSKIDAKRGDHFLQADLPLPMISVGEAKCFQICRIEGGKGQSH